MTERQRIAVEFLKKHKDVSKIRLARLLYKEHGGLFPTVETARSILRYVTGSYGKKDKKQAIVTDKKRAGSKVYGMPKSTAKAWLPHVCKSDCIAIFSDCHFPVHDAEAIEASVKHVKENFEPSTILLNGDFADAIEFGSWAKSPKALQIENSLDVVRRGLLYFRNQFPDAEIIYKFGNHEDRLERFCWGKAPELVGMEHITWKGLLTIDNDLNKVQELKDIVWVGEERPIVLGKLTVFHGHELPKGLANSVNPARGAFLRTLDSVLVGHHHRSSSHPEYNWKREPINCWSVGCLCDMTPRYARINKWNLGHAVVDVSKSGSFSVHNFKQLKNNEIVMA